MSNYYLPEDAPAEVKASFERNHNVYLLFKRLEVKSWQKLFVKLDARDNRIKELETDLQSVKEKVVQSLYVKDWAAALKRLNALCSTGAVGIPIHEQYNLDLSYLDHNSPQWKFVFNSDDAKVEKEVEKHRAKTRGWREKCWTMTTEYLQDVYQTCIEEGVDNIEYYLQLSVSILKDDYLSLEYKDFWLKYDAERDPSLQLIKDSDRIPLYECLDFIEEYCPKKLFEDLSQPDVYQTLGTVSREQFSKWENAYINNSQLRDAKERMEAQRSLMKRIGTALIWRSLGDSEGWPDLYDENVLERLLSTPEEHPAVAEWQITEETPLTGFLKVYVQLTGKGADVK